MNKFQRINLGIMLLNVAFMATINKDPNQLLHLLAFLGSYAAFVFGPDK